MTTLSKLAHILHCRRRNRVALSSYFEPMSAEDLSLVKPGFCERLASSPPRRSRGWLSIGRH